MSPEFGAGWCERWQRLRANVCWYLRALVDFEQNNRRRCFRLHYHLRHLPPAPAAAARPVQARATAPSPSGLPSFRSGHFLRPTNMDTWAAAQ